MILSEKRQIPKLLEYYSFLNKNSCLQNFSMLYSRCGINRSILHQAVAVILSLEQQVRGQCKPAGLLAEVTGSTQLEGGVMDLPALSRRR